jgi:uncharacterized protein YfaS (alpha-2-macroglobulin family)
MNDKEFAELQLRMTIVPQQARWPAPDFLHWQRLHAVANEARERMSKAYAQMDEIDRNVDLSRDGKERRRRKAAAQAAADFEASKTLARAREAVRYVLEEWNRDDVSSEIAEARAAALKALKETEVGWQKAIDKIAERATLTKGPITTR